MIPKLLMKGDQGHGAFAPHFPPDPSRFAPIIPQYHVNQFVPTNVVMQATSDIDSLLQVHRRKMLRRAANRRSAQQSRARKKVKTPTTTPSDFFCLFIYLFFWMSFLPFLALYCSFRFLDDAFTIVVRR